MNRELNEETSFIDFHINLNLFNSENESYKYKSYGIIPFVFIFLYLLLLNQPLNFKFEKNENNLVQPNLNNETLRLLSNKKKQKIVLNEEEKFMKELLINTSKIGYEGKWNSNLTYIGNSFSGLFFMDISLSNNLVSFKSRAIEGNYVDNWNLIYSNQEIYNLSLKIINNFTFNIIGDFRSSNNIGMVFDLYKRIRSCKTSLNITIKNITKIYGRIYSLECNNLDIYFEVGKPKEYAEYKIVNTYCFIVIILCIFSLLSSFWLIHLFKSSPEIYRDTFSLPTLLYNLIWNIFGFVIHIKISVENFLYLFQFLMIALSFFLNIILCDFRLLHLIWRDRYLKIINNSRISDNFKKKLPFIQLTIYFISFSALFRINELIFNPKYIMLCVLMTWMPQIIYNSVYNINSFAPSFYIFFLSVNRLFIPCYFRGYQNNFYLISPNYKVVIKSSIIMILMILLMYSQKIFGTRWFLPLFKNTKEGKYLDEKDLNELISKRNNKEKIIECVICLKDINVDKLNESLSTVLNDFNILDKKNKGNDYWDDYGFFWKPFYFSKRKINYNNKPYFLSSCNHLFHSECIDNWLNVKRECPVCRSNIYIE